MLSPYLTRDHGLDTIRRWATALHAFRFCRNPGGHTDGGDHFLVALATHGEPDYREVLAAFGLDAAEVPPDAPTPEPGRAYSGTEWQRFPSRVPGHPHLQQPGHAEVYGERCFVWATADRISLSVHGAPPAAREVTEADFLRAQRIERRLGPLTARIVDPPMQSAMCVCPQHYPELWATPAG